MEINACPPQPPPSFLVSFLLRFRSYIVLSSPTDKGPWSSSDQELIGICSASWIAIILLRHQVYIENAWEQHWQNMQAEWLADRQTNRQTDGQKDGQYTDICCGPLETHCQTGWLTQRQTDRQAYRQNDWKTKRKIKTIIRTKQMTIHNNPLSHRPILMTEKPRRWVYKSRDRKSEKERKIVKHGHSQIDNASADEMMMMMIESV